ERGFAATRRSDERDEIAAIDLQVDVAERLHLAVAGLKGERDAARVDRQSWSGGGRFETRPRAVCATRQGAARRLRQGPQYHHQLRPGGRFCQAIARQFVPTFACTGRTLGTTISAFCQ